MKPLSQEIRELAEQVHDKPTFKDLVLVAAVVVAIIVLLIFVLT